MKKITLKTLCLILILLSFACSNDYKFKLNHKKEVALNETLQVTLKEEKDKTVKKVTFFVNGKEIATDKNSVSINTKDLGVGKHKISALIAYEEKTKTKNSFFEVLANVKPTIYTYKIVNTYPHDTDAYTQGLEYYNGYLYETTGKNGKSTLRKVDIKTGKVLQKIAIDDKYFGEGMTIFNNKIYWLTW
jgi:glutaminyl-peptide cyclotransferase